MASRDRGLQDLIQRHASGAQRGPLARFAGENDDDTENRFGLVGDAIEGAATTNSDSARLDAAPVSTQPTHDTTQGDVNMSQHLESGRSTTQPDALASLDSNEEALAPDEAFDRDDLEHEGEDSDTPPDPGMLDAARQLALQQALREVQSRYIARTGRSMDAEQIDIVQSLLGSPSATCEYLVDRAVEN